MNDYAKHQTEYAKRNAREALDNARATVARALLEIDRYIERYEEAETLHNKADVMNWTLSHLAGYIGNNARLDLLARAQAELIRADAMNRSGT
ncbi:MAG: hypothetical protein LBE62_12045 [Azonexus sp.]|jgi:hypothetical protein|nr:hypothetical protein [Azonexus sp.]